MLEAGKEMEGSIVTCGMIVLNTLAGQAFIKEMDLLLTPKEFSLLHLLARNEGQIIIRKVLYESIWNRPFTDTDRTLKSCISRLRGKMTDSDCYITAVRSKGYRLEVRKNQIFER